MENGYLLSFEIIMILAISAVILNFLIIIFISTIAFTPRQLIKEILEHMNLDSKDTLSDLGVGDGRIVIQAKKLFNTNSKSMELSPIMLSIAKFKRLLARVNDRDIEINLDSFTNQDFSEITKIYCYLNSKALVALSHALSHLLKPGTLVYSYANPLPNLTPIKTIVLSNKKSLYLYRV